MSDIVICGMTMPNTCCDCPCFVWDANAVSSSPILAAQNNGTMVCVFTGEEIWNTQRGDNCPLHLLPAGHGRLINADELVSKYTEEINKWEEWAGIYVKEGKREGFRACRIKAAYLNEAKLNIMAAPTIVPAEGGTNNGRT